MRKIGIFVYSIGSCVLSIPAAAADLPARKGPPAFAVAPFFDWTGFYVGVSGAWSAGHTLTTQTLVQLPGGGAVLANRNDSRLGFSGLALGGQAGFNYQLPNRIVIGVETELEWTAAKLRVRDSDTQASIAPGGVNLTSTSERKGTGAANWLGSTRVRLGYAIPGGFLPYVTGGVAYTSLSANLLYVPAVFGFGPTQVTLGGGRAKRVGWTVGAGAEYAVTDNLSLKTEYLYSQFGGIAMPVATLNNFGGPPWFGTLVSGSIGLHTVRAGLNWRFGDSRMGATDPGAVSMNLPTGRGHSVLAAAASHDWTGFYVGVNGALSAGRARTSQTLSQSTGIGSANLSDTKSLFGFGGLALGGQAGFNYQLSNRIVMGVEADLQWTAAKVRTRVSRVQTTSIPGFASFWSADGGAAKGRVDWYGSTRARLGFTVRDHFLPYVTGGIAYASFAGNLDYATLGVVTTFTQGVGQASRIGWTLGAGAEYAMTNNLSFKTEYLYSQFGGLTMNMATLATALPIPPFPVAPPIIGTIRAGRIGLHTMRAGLNWKFGGARAEPINNRQ